MEKPGSAVGPASADPGEMEEDVSNQGGDPFCNSTLVPGDSPGNISGEHVCFLFAEPRGTNSAFCFLTLQVDDLTFLIEEDLNMSKNDESGSPVLSASPTPCKRDGLGLASNSSDVTAGLASLAVVSAIPSCQSSCPLGKSLHDRSITGDHSRHPETFEPASSDTIRASSYPPPCLSAGLRIVGENESLVPVLNSSSDIFGEEIQRPDKKGAGDGEGDGCRRNNGLQYQMLAAPHPCEDE
jgi:hypothetical protein